MKTARFTTLVLVLVLLLVSVNACAPKNIYTLKCDISNNISDQSLSVGFDISGERSGDTVTETMNNEESDFEYDSQGQVSLFTTHIDRDLVYQNSGHSYHVAGIITIAPLTQVLHYNIVATGDTFSTPQSCIK